MKIVPLYQNTSSAHKRIHDVYFADVTSQKALELPHTCTSIQ